MSSTAKVTAIDAFMARKLEIDTILKRLMALWGHLGTLVHYAELKRITDSAFKEGEHAK